MEKNLEIVKKTLINNENNINKNYNYNLINGLYLLEGHIIKRDIKQIKKSKKEIKEDNKIIKEYLFKEMNTQLNDMLKCLV